MTPRKKLIISLSLVLVLSIAACWAFSRLRQRQYDYLYYDGTYYIVTHETVPPEQLGEQVGEVSRRTDRPLWGESRNLDSNLLPVGTPVYALPDEGGGPGKHLAVLWQGNYQKAYQVFDEPPGE